MKILKGDYMRYRHTVNLLYFALLICVFLRTVQLIFTVDETTGFIKQQYTGISTVIMIVICASVAAVSILGYTSDCIKGCNVKFKPCVAVSSALAGGMFIFNVVSSVANLQSGGWYNVLLVILGIPTAVAFFAYGLKNVYDYNSHTMIFSIPVFYFILKLITVFVSTSALSLVTENIFLIFTNGTLLIFMFEFAKFENNISGGKNENKKLFASSIASVMLCTVSTVPKIINVAVKNITLSNKDISEILLTVSVGIFVFAFTVCNFSDSAKRRKKSVARHLAE